MNQGVISKDIDWKDAITLREHILELLRQGKRSEHPDFLALMKIYGKSKITAIAREILKELKDGRSS